MSEDHAYRFPLHPLAEALGIEGSMAFAISVSEYSFKKRSDRIREEQRTIPLMATATRRPLRPLARRTIRPYFGAFW